MSWRPITAQQVISRFTSSERAMLLASSGALDALPTRLSDAVATFVGAMQAAEWDVNTDGTVPDSVRSCVMSYAVWEWLTDFPQLDKFKTKERQAKYDDAVKDLEAIRNRTFGAIEPPNGVDTTTGNWNSKPKLVMRTDPHPQPLEQLQISPSPIYANPNAPQDTVPSSSPGVPAPVNSFQAIAINGTVILYWTPVAGAQSYLIYRATTSGQEVPATGTPPLATVLGNTTNYTDATVTAGQPYFYQVAVLGQSGVVSTLSAEASATP